MSVFDYLGSFVSICATVVNSVIEFLNTTDESDIVRTNTTYQRPVSTATYRSSVRYNRLRPVYRTSTNNGRTFRRNNENANDQYAIPDEIKEYLYDSANNRNNEDVLNDSKFYIGNTPMHIKRGRLNLTEENYVKYMHILLWLEEFEDKLNFNNCEFHGVQISYISKGKIYCMYLPGVDDTKSPFFVGSTFIIKNSGEFTAPNKHMFTRIKSIDGSTIYFELKGFGFNDLDEKRFDIQFKFSRFLYMKMHLSVDNVAKYSRSLVFPREATRALSMTRPMSRYFNPNIESNYEQMIAVTRIVQGSSGTAPFILHGPPGTGKTVTVVEAILQLVKQNSSNRLLVCAHSNTAVDNVASVLIKYVKKFDKNLFLRVYSKSRECIPDHLTDFSKFSPVEQTKLTSYRIILCTLSHTTSYNLNFITHIVIDEAGQACEPSCFLPLGKRMGPPQLILSGDDKQLGPVVLSNEAKKFGFEISLMERLKRDCKLYSSGNDRYMVMLKKNYRSDFDIINIPNIMLYDGKLSAMAKSDTLTRKNILNSKSTCRGIAFHAVLSTEYKTDDKPSYYNVSEFDIVKKYVKELRKTYYVKDEDIGIITPYSAQVTLIKDWVKKQKLKIDVDTVDAFQGQERRVILISTVRGKGERTDNVKLGFLTDVKRFNVALTRAKAKAIIIGNPICLRTDNFWSTYIQQCKRIGTYYGVNVRESSQTRDDLNVMMNNLHL